MSNNITELKKHLEDFGYKVYAQGSTDELEFPSIYLASSRNNSTPALNSYDNSITVQYSIKERNDAAYNELLLALESYIPVTGTHLFRINSESDGIDSQMDIFYYQIQI